MARLFSRLMTSRHHLRRRRRFCDCGGRRVRRPWFSPVPRSCLGSAGGRRQRCIAGFQSGRAIRRKPRLRRRWGRRPDPAPPSGHGQTLPAGTARPQTGATSLQAPGGRCGHRGGGQPGSVSARRGHSSPRQAQQAAPGARRAPSRRQTIKDEMAKLSKDWLFGPAAFPGDMLCDTYTVKSRRPPGDPRPPDEGPVRDPDADQRHPAGPRPPGRPGHQGDSRAVPREGQPFHLHAGPVPAGHVRAELQGGIGQVRLRDACRPLARSGARQADEAAVDRSGHGQAVQVDGPGLPLGSRWIGAGRRRGPGKGRTGFAIHGTKDPEQIGTAGSRGCIRMYNGDAVLMYNLLVPLYSQVDVVD